MDQIKKVGQWIAKLLLRYIARMFFVLISSMIPIIILSIFVFLILDSMFNQTGALNFTGRDNFNITIGQEIKNMYVVKADEWKEGLTEEEIEQVYQYNHDLSWAVPAAIDKLAYNFEDESKREEYLNRTYEFVKPIFEFKDSTITTTTVTTDEQGNRVTETDTETIRLITRAETYIGTYKYYYKWMTETSGNTTTKKEVLDTVESDVNYSKVKEALKYYGLESETNVDIVIFQAYALDKNLVDPKVKTLLPKSMWSLVARSPFGIAPRNLEGRIDLYAVLPRQTPTGYIDKLNVNIQAYDQSWRVDQDRTEIGTLPRRGSNFRFGTLAVSKNNPYGLDLGMKLYIPGYGYGVVEEYSENIRDRLIEDSTGEEIASFISVFPALADWFYDSVVGTNKDDVVYLFMGDSDEYEPDKLRKAQVEIGRFWQTLYAESEAYIFPPDYEVPMPQMETAGEIFFDGSTWPVTSGFGYREDPFTGERSFHAGQDWGLPIGIPILSINSGIVEVSRNSQTAGKFVRILLDTKAIEGNRKVDIKVRYLHMSALAVREGDRVNQGEIVGFVGSTGRSTGPHMHMEVWVDGEPRDPLNWIELIKSDGVIDIYREQGTFEGGSIDDED
ncbi:peptidoglycan DD-metalloendopeptidase family protein [Microaerobacter geothermalis]|uniref:peptidoglycan DD-metalloendopeptidase family protein n=1 Tax=Microaerobacter geothermalis TaxID=674972 RepID=UPI001F2329DE|nr:peptidoglycan DD-metalloendopeptidase family protein [Microaerobacter geothermalis]MCF6094313.1 peptidoglycan DD-metalloendopeptidase family protein [Microaerobacter geothermalis]